MFSSNKKQQDQRDKVGVVDLKQATSIIQKIIQEPQALGEERATQNKQVLEDAMAGAPGMDQKSQEIIAGLLDENGVEVEGMETRQVAYKIYKYAWGLGPIEEAYNDLDVNEIRINAPKDIYVLRKIKNERLNGVSFHDDEHIRKIVTRITMHDQGIALNKSCPTIESMRRDGTRITATCPPVTKNTTLVLRKPYPHLITPEEMIALGTMDKKVWAVLKTSVKAGANILIAGGVGSGKTTLMRTVSSEIDQSERIIVLETDSELMLGKAFPDRDIIEFEEHRESKRSMGELFIVILRYSPTRILIGEFRGAGEAKEAIRACVRGHSSMATAHFSSPKEAIEGTARLLLEEGMNLPLDVAVLTVASAFNIVVQMFGDPVRGAIMVESVTEVIVDQGEAKYQDLIRWTSHGTDYLDGSWQHKGELSPAMIDRLCKHISIDELRGAGLA
ncbi:MAG: ATPase, T2SS/T4P/T4SS family [Thermacetogeniaceae bacterium]